MILLVVGVYIIVGLGFTIGMVRLGYSGDDQWDLGLTFFLWLFLVFPALVLGAGHLINLFFGRFLKRRQR